MTDAIELYGHYVFTHGWGRVLTVMSPAGAAAVLRAVRVADGIAVKAAAGQLPQFHEKRAGALESFADANGIKILDKTAWDARKADLGELIYR